MILPILLTIAFLAFLLMFAAEILDDPDSLGVLSFVGVAALTFAVIYCLWTDPSLRSPQMSYTQTIVVQS